VGHTLRKKKRKVSGVVRKFLADGMGLLEPGGCRRPGFSAYLLHGTVDLDVNVVTQLVVAQIGRQRDVTMLPIAALEHVPRAGTVALAARHLDLIYVLLTLQQQIE
jgi:hypothetical protein